jgi:hypothetical protein
MTEDFTRQDFLLEQWKAASELHRHMDQMAWHSLSYFAALNGVLLSVFSVVWSSKSLSIRGKEIFSLGIAVFAALASFMWSKIQKRFQLYHRLRSRQANTKEKALRNLTSDQVDAAEDECILIYDGKPVQEHKDVMDDVPCSRWGRTPNHSLVFGLAIGLMIIWSLISAAILVALAMPSLIDPTLATLFESPIQP